MKVRGYEQQVDTLNVPTVAAPNIPIPGKSAFGDIQRYQDIQDLGETIGKAGNQISQRWQERQDLEWKQKSADLRTQYSQEQNDDLLSNEEIMIKRENQDVPVPRGLLNRKGNNATGAYDEYVALSDQRQKRYLSQIKDPKRQAELAQDFVEMDAQKAAHVLTHESNQWNLAKADSFKNAYSQAVSDGDMVRAEKAQIDLNALNGTDPSADIRKARKDVAESVINAKLSEDISGVASGSYLESISESLDKKDLFDLKKHISTTSKALKEEKDREHEATRTANFNSLVGGIIDGKITVLNKPDIAKMGLAGDLPEGASETIIKFLNTVPSDDGEIDTQGLDESVVENARAVLGIAGNKDLNSAIINILGDKGFRDTEEGRNRAMVLLQVARELGPIKAAEPRKIASDSLNSVLTFQETLGVPQGRAVLDFMKLIKSGMAPQEAATTTIERETLRQVNSKEKDKVLIASIVDGMQDYSHSGFGDEPSGGYPGNISKAVFQYALKTGLEGSAAAELANKVMAPVQKSIDRVDFLQKLTESLDKNIPSLKFSSTIPKDLEEVLRSHQLIKFIAEDNSPEMEEYRAKNPYAYAALATVQELGAAGFSFLNGFTAGIPGEFMKKAGIELPSAPTPAGRITQGVGDLYGFIKGIPGKAAALTVGRISKAKPIVDFVEKLSARGKAAAITATVAYHAAEAGASLGVMSAVNTPESGILDWKARAEHAINGSATGIAFGVIGTISSTAHPTLTQALRMAASSLVTWVPSHASGQSVEDQAFQFALGLYFGRNGIKWPEINKAKAEVKDLMEKSSEPAAVKALENAENTLESLSEKNVKSNLQIIQEQQAEADVQKADQREALIKAAEGAKDVKGIQDGDGPKDVKKEEAKSEELKRPNRSYPEKQREFTEDEKNIMRSLQGEASSPGTGRIIKDSEGNVTGRQGSERAFDFMSFRSRNPGESKQDYNKAYNESALTKKQIEATFKNALEGKPLTNKQTELVDRILSAAKEHSAFKKEVENVDSQYPGLSEESRARIREENIRSADQKEPVYQLSAKDVEFEDGPATGKGVAGPGKKKEPPSKSEVTLDENIPEGGETRGLSKSVEADAIERGLIEDSGELPTYERRGIQKKIASQVQEFINRDPDLAKKIAFGEAPEQDGLRSQELFTGIRVKALLEGDVATIHELIHSGKATAAATELGQRVKALDPGYAQDPVSVGKDLLKAREEAVKEKLPGKDIKKAKKEVVEEIKKEVKKAAPKIKDWNDFIDSIKC